VNIKAAERRTPEQLEERSDLAAPRIRPAGYVAQYENLVVARGQGRDHCLTADARVGGN
jgi:hypothetical protein